MSELNWDHEVWKIIDSYFKSTDNYLTKNQIDSYNTFLKKNITWFNYHNIPKSLSILSNVVLASDCNSLL